jgi:hypothetical protein
VFTPSTLTVGVVVPNFTLPSLASPGFAPLSGTSANASALQFAVTGPGLQTQPITWEFGVGNPVQIRLYYNASEIPAGRSSSDLVVLGFTGSTWLQVGTGVVHTATNVTGNTFVVDLPNSSTPAYALYGIFYPSTTASLSGTATAVPTPLPFKPTRSFNPTSSNQMLRKAKFFYHVSGSGPAPRELEVKIYDTAGTLVRGLSVGQGVNLMDVQNDPLYGNSANFFTWDGANDTGNLVKNGIYLVRWKLTRSDGSTDVQTKLVALIK